MAKIDYKTKTPLDVLIEYQNRIKTTDEDEDILHILKSVKTSFSDKGEKECL